MNIFGKVKLTSKVVDLLEFEIELQSHLRIVLTAFRILWVIVFRDRQIYEDESSKQITEREILFETTYRQFLMHCRPSYHASRLMNKVWFERWFMIRYLKFLPSRNQIKMKLFGLNQIITSNISVVEYFQPIGRNIETIDRVANGEIKDCLNRNI